MHIRPATAADAPELARIKREAGARAYGRLLGASALARWAASSASEAWFAWRIGRAAYHVLVAEIDGKVAGYAGFRVRGSRADGHSVGLYVRESGQGIGSALHSAREQLARSLDCTAMRVACWRENLAAIGFVTKLGFARTGTGFRDASSGQRVDHYERALA
jgi:L-amino acid N-acyltransferase YncA